MEAGSDDASGEKSVIDCAGEEKAAMSIDDILEKFNEISIECGN